MLKALVLALCLVGLLLSCGSNWTYSFRIAVEIDTPDGLKTGSSVVRAFSGQSDWGPLEARGVKTDLRGDAVFIDLGGGKNIIALLAFGPHGQASDFEFLVLRAFYPMPSTQGTIGLGGYVDELARLPPGSSVRLPPDVMPTFVTFANLNDPGSARVVYATGRRIETRQLPNGSQNYDRGPMIFTNDFARTFGPGYGLRGVTIEMVSPGVWPFNSIGLSGTPVRREIESKLPFLKSHREQLSRQLSYPGRYNAYRLQFTR